MWIMLCLQFFTHFYCDISFRNFPHVEPDCRYHVFTKLTRLLQAYMWSITDAVWWRGDMTYGYHINKRRLSRILKSNKSQLHLFLPEQAPQPVQ